MRPATAAKTIALGLALFGGAAAAQDVTSGGASPVYAADDDTDRLPKGAPTDDYEFVGWCVGVLSTHMQLFDKVKPELDVISKRWDTVAEDAKSYADQRSAGEQDLTLFRGAMRAAEAASPRDIRPNGRIAIQRGVAMWNDIDKVDVHNQAYSWMNWELPPRCETVAHDLESRSMLAQAVLKDNSGAVATAPTRSEPRPAAAEPAKPAGGPSSDEDAGPPQLR